LAITNHLDDHLGLAAWRETLLESPSKARLKMIADLHGSSDGISTLPFNRLMHQNQSSI
jgi:hypothetical protein